MRHHAGKDEDYDLATPKNVVCERTMYWQDTSVLFTQCNGTPFVELNNNNNNNGEMK